MLDDVIEGLVKGTLRLIFWLFVEVLLFYTGEIILYIVTFGRKRPRWNYYADVSGGKWVLLTDLSTCIGFATWLFIFGYIIYKLTGN